MRTAESGNVRVADMNRISEYMKQSMKLALSVALPVLVSSVGGCGSSDTPSTTAPPPAATLPTHGQSPMALFPLE